MSKLESTTTQEQDTTTPIAMQVTEPESESEPKPAPMSVDTMIEQSIGRVNFAQVIQAILVAILAFFESQQTYISVFAHAQPAWHCTTNRTTATSSCTSKSSLCTLSKLDWAWNSGKVHTSIISEWGLECSSSFLVGFPITSFFLGCLLGGLLLATLGDSWLGRKKLVCLSSLIMSVAAFLSAFSPNIWVYSVFRFLSGAGRAPLAVCTLVLLTERVGKRWRSQAALVGFTHFSLGILALIGIAYLTRDSSWRKLYLWTSIPGIICSIMCYFFIFESPRWLFLQGRRKDAFDVLRSLGSKTMTFSDSLNTGFQQNATKTSPIESLKILIRRRWAIQRLLVSMCLSFGIGLMYLGMFLGVENWGFDIYLTSTFIALVSLCSYLLAFLFWMQRYNRRTSLFGFCTISGITSIVFSILGKRGNEGVQIGLEAVSLFCACMAYNILLMYIVEIFPTCVRSSASSLVRQATIFGSVFDPVLILVGRENTIYSYGVFGVVMLVCGLLVYWLPETKGKTLCDTMEEQEFRDNENKIIV